MAATTFGRFALAEIVDADLEARRAAKRAVAAPMPRLAPVTIRSFV